MTGTDFLDARQADMHSTFARHTQLTATLATLRNATAMDRIALFHRLNDAEILRNTWADFTPAIPVTSAGAVTAATGFFGGWASVTALLSLIAIPFRRPRKPAPNNATARRDPPLRRPAQNTTQTPRLMGETRL
jgi:hypothetical protein